MRDGAAAPAVKCSAHWPRRTLSIRFEMHLASSSHISAVHPLIPKPSERDALGEPCPWQGLRREDAHSRSDSHHQRLYATPHAARIASRNVVFISLDVFGLR